MKPVATIFYRQIAMEMAEFIVVIRLSEPKKPKYLQENFDFETPPYDKKTSFRIGPAVVICIYNPNTLNF